MDYTHIHLNNYMQLSTMLIFFSTMFRYVMLSVSSQVGRCYSVMLTAEMLRSAKLRGTRMESWMEVLPLNPAQRQAINSSSNTWFLHTVL
jgi:hypothetical protein